MGYLIEIDPLPTALIIWPQPQPEPPEAEPEAAADVVPPDFNYALEPIGATKSNLGRAARRRNREPLPRIAMETPLVPAAVAAAVCEEASIWLDEPLPRWWRRVLIRRANAIYARNPQFRRKIRGRDTHGRDWLWAFTRHWLAGLMLKHRPDLHERLPSSYQVGQPLPEETAPARQNTATDQQIDRLVYDLYGLTADEIKIVEGAA
jgi:hypothetical protein